MIDENAALLLIDVQQGFGDPIWGERNNPLAEARIHDLLVSWRTVGAPVFHVRHESRHASGIFRRDTPAIKAVPEAKAHEGEPVIWKTVNCAFIHTSLEAELRPRRITTLVVAGLTTNHCVSTTVRMAGNLGFETFVASDACAAFETVALDGTIRPAEDVHAAALSDLDGEFATVAESRWLSEMLTKNTSR